MHTWLPKRPAMCRRASRCIPPAECLGFRQYRCAAFSTPKSTGLPPAADPLLPTARYERQRAQGRTFDVRSIHTHRPEADLLPVMQVVVVMRRQKVSRFTDGVDEPADVGRRKIDNLSI